MRQPFESRLPIGPTLAESTWADDGGQTRSDRQERPRDAYELQVEVSTTLPDLPRGDATLPERTLAAHYPGPLERLYARHTLIATGRAEGDSHLVHLAIMDRLSANGRIAEVEGWMALALERVGGMGRVQLWGVPPTAARREVVPDWAPR